jgi:hypothetical protein
MAGFLLHSFPSKAAFCFEIGLYVYEHHGDAVNTWGRTHFVKLIQQYGVGPVESSVVHGTLGYTAL